MKILENVELKKYSTFFVGGVCKYFIEIKNKEDLLSTFSFIKEKKESGEINDFYILGGGSNTIFSDNLEKLCVIKIDIKNNFEVLENGGGSAAAKNTNKGEVIFVKSSAGNIWDDLVLFCSKQNYFGLENLSYIPGSVGASPVQNIGAYGVEVKDFIENIEIYNIEKNIFEILENKLLVSAGGEAASKKENNLEFGYRDSIFKKNKNKYIILNVTFKLLLERNQNINYEGLEIGILDNAESIRNKVINIRKSKLPEWKEIPNCGSFFKNPIVNKKELGRVLKINQNLKYFTFGNDYKLSAAQLIDSLDFKGFSVGDAKVSPKHALIIINENKNAIFKDVYDLSEIIINKIKTEHNIILEREVNMI